MNEQEIRELLKLVRGIEHFLERCLKTITEQQLKEKGIVITEDKHDDHITHIGISETKAFEF